MMLRASATLIAVLLAGCSSAPDPGSAGTEDRQSITEVVRGGITAEHTAFIPVPPICPGPVPATVREQLLRDAPTRLGAYFTSPQLEKNIDVITKVVTQKDGPACAYGAGVDWVRLDRMSTMGSSAVATGQVRLWSKLAQWQESGPKMAEPRGTIDVIVNLSRIDGHWLISRYEWKFARGSEP
jgi:hypothetical protein